MILLLEQGKDLTSERAANHQLVIYHGTKAKEELSNIQVYLANRLLLDSPETIASDLPIKDIYGGRFDLNISIYQLQLHLSLIYELHKNIDLETYLIAKIKSLFKQLKASQLEYNSPGSHSFEDNKLLLQSLATSIDQLEGLHNLKYKETIEQLKSNTYRDNRIMMAFLALLAILSFYTSRWAIDIIRKGQDKQRQIELELLQNRQQLESIVEALPDSVMQLSSDGKVLVSKAGEATLGLTGEYITGRQLSQLPIPEAIRKEFIDTIKKAISSSEVCSFEYALADNQFYETRILKFREDEVVCIVRNITEQKLISQQQESLTAELQDKNAELERFVYTVSHDLRSPLVTINGFIGLLKKDVELNDTKKINSDLDRICQATDTMSELLNGLLELSRIGRIVNPPQSGSLNSLINKAIENLRDKIKQSGVEIEIGDNMPYYWGDQLRLLEVIQNLIENAIKFMGDQPAPRIEINALETKGYLKCTVKDNGIGIDPRYHDRIFELFERLNPEIDGTGIGLALTKRIIEAHHGTIIAEPNSDQQGTSFIISLPVQPVEKNSKLAAI